MSGVYEKHLLKNSRLPFIFNPVTKLLPNHSIGEMNWHENIEILSVTDGSGLIVDDTRHIAVQAGDLVVINTNHLHSVGTSNSSLAYRYLIVDRAFCLANGFDTAQICFQEHFRDETISCLIEQIAEEYKNLSQSEYGIPAIRSLILQTMTALCRNYSAGKEKIQESSHLISCIKQALGYIHSHYMEDISLDEIAEFVGLSKYYFAHEFRRVTGYTFVSYVNFTRCEHAKFLIGEGKYSLADIADACGLHDRSYFTQIFSKYVGSSPSAYRRELFGGED